MHSILKRASLRYCGKRILIKKSDSIPYSRSPLNFPQVEVQKRSLGWDLTNNDIHRICEGILILGSIRCWEDWDWMVLRLSLQILKACIQQEAAFERMHSQIVALFFESFEGCHLLNRSVPAFSQHFCSYWTLAPIMSQSALHPADLFLLSPDFNRH